MAETTLQRHLIEEAYAQYSKVARDPRLSYSEFAEFWSEICQADREWWLQEFKSGETNLSRDLIDADSGFADLRAGRISHELVKTIEQVRNRVKNR
jgi:hypothetical protein